MEEYLIKIIEIEQVTHDVKRLKVEKPAGYQFLSGQATDISINKPRLTNEKRPFSFTCLNTDPYLEFIIKIYKEHEGITREISRLNRGDELIIGNPWGAIHYKGPGIFIAGGAGITPFLSILRQLKKEGPPGHNKLIFSNKTAKDIIYHEELFSFLNHNLILMLTREKNDLFTTGRIDKNLLKKIITGYDQNFYICGPDAFVTDIKGYLEELGAATESLIIEM